MGGVLLMGSLDCGELKSLPAHQCLPDRNDFRRPWKKGAVSREEWQEATCCYPEVRRQVLHLFGSEASRDAWPQLLTNMHSDHLQDTQQGPAQTCPPPFPTDIRKYFERISSYLKAKGYSPCSWEIVTTEIQAALSGFPGSHERSQD
nr:interferon alpha-2-like [Meriones unguiculatus]